MGRAAAFLKALEPFVWRRNLDFAAIADIHSIKRQIHVHKTDERLTAPASTSSLAPAASARSSSTSRTQQLILGGATPGCARAAPSTP